MTGTDSQADPLSARLLAHSVLGVASLLALFPFAFAVLMSIGVIEFAEVTGRIWFRPGAATLDHYAWVWLHQPLDRWILNSLIVTVAVVLVLTFADAALGYALAKGRFAGRRSLSLLVLGLLIVPPRVVVVPLYIQLVALDLDNTYWGIIVPFLANPFGVFLMRQYFLGLPDALIEAARIDGCSQVQVFTRIVLPMAKPALALLAIFTFMFTWNALLWPSVIVLDESMFTLQVGLAAGTNMAGVIIGTIPMVLFFVVAYRAVQEGIVLPGQL